MEKKYQSQRFDVRCNTIGNNRLLEVAEDNEEKGGLVKACGHWTAEIEGWPELCGGDVLGVANWGPSTLT